MIMDADPDFDPDSDLGHQNVSTTFVSDNF
jgi:hypothetical protein